MKRLALLSMDVEDWYHLEYFAGAPRPENTPSLLDGVERFRDLLAEEGVPATFFTLGEVAEGRGALLRELVAEGHEVASHGPDHRLLSRMSTADFTAGLGEHKERLEQVVGRAVAGYRAPCFSMDREKLDRLPELGFRYDSSWIRFAAHSLYGAMDLSDWHQPVAGMYRDPRSGLVEIEIPTGHLGGRRVPVAGGAYFRIFPWPLMRGLLRRFLAGAGVYVFYIHPFECSAVPAVDYPAGTGAAARLRFQAGRGRTLPRLRALIAELRAAGFAFATCAAAVDALPG